MCKKNKAHASSLGDAPQTADTELALGVNSGDTRRCSARLSPVNISPPARCVYLLIHSAPPALYGRLATRKWPQEDTQTRSPRPAGHGPAPGNQEERGTLSVWKGRKLW